MRYCLILLVSIFFFNSASALNINLNADGYSGTYYFDGSGPTYSGNSTVNLSVGSHTLYIVYGGSVNFTVNSDGSVTSGDLDILLNSGSTLTFNNVEIEIDMNQYTQIYQFSCAGFYNYSTTHRVPVEIEFSLTVPPCNLAGTFTVDAVGDVTILTGGDKFVASGNEITFTPFKVDVDPQVYDGIYSFMGKGHMSGPSEQYFLPNLDYTVSAETGATLGVISTNSTGLDSSSTNFLKAEGNLLTFYMSRYTVTPPSGFTIHYVLYGHGAKTGVQDVWLIRGGPSWLNASFADYPYTATSNCTSFTITTSVGVFNFECDNDAALYFSPLTEDGFNDIDFGFISKRYDGRFSTTIGDYDLTVNGASINISSADLSRDTFHETSAFSQGRNVAVFDGEDEDATPFTITKTFWAGGAEVTVMTQGATDTVTLTVEQTISGTTYRQSVVQEAVSNSTVFENIPQITNGVVYVSTTRGLKKLDRKLPKSSIIHL